MIRTSALFKAVVASLVALVLGMCSPPSSTTGSPKPSPTVSAGAAKTLTCDDQAGPATPASSGLHAGDLIFDLLDKPRAQSSAVALPVAGTTYYLYKAFVYVVGSPHSRTTFAVEQPNTARLYYTDPQTWATQRSPAAILRAATRQVIVEACQGLTGYTGGLLVQSSTCLRLIVTSKGESTEAKALLGVDAC